MFDCRFCGLEFSSSFELLDHVVDHGLDVYVDAAAQADAFRDRRRRELLELVPASRDAAGRYEWECPLDGLVFLVEAPEELLAHAERHGSIEWFMKLVGARRDARERYLREIAFFEIANDRDVEIRGVSAEEEILVRAELEVLKAEIRAR